MKKIQSSTTKPAKIQRLLEEEKRDIKFNGGLQENYKHCVKFVIFNNILSKREMDNEGTTRENSRVF